MTCMTCSLRFGLLDGESVWQSIDVLDAKQLQSHMFFSYRAVYISSCTIMIRCCCSQPGLSKMSIWLQTTARLHGFPSLTAPRSGSVQVAKDLCLSQVPFRAALNLNACPADPSPQHVQLGSFEIPSSTLPALDKLTVRASGQECNPVKRFA